MPYTLLAPHRLQVAFLLDVVRAPAWVFAKWPDARAADRCARGALA